MPQVLYQSSTHQERCFWYVKLPHYAVRKKNRGIPWWIQHYVLSHIHSAHLWMHHTAVECIGTWQPPHRRCKIMSCTLHVGFLICHVASVSQMPVVPECLVYEVTKQLHCPLQCIYFGSSDTACVYKQSLLSGIATLLYPSFAVIQQPA